MSDLAALAVESYGDDVREVADELAHAVDVPAFAAALRELMELASSGRVLVADEGDALLVTTEARGFELSVTDTEGGPFDARSS